MTPPASANSNARGRATARSIESAAVRLASEHGAAALTVDQICDAAGVKQRTFFNHFRTKEDALLGSALPVLDEQRTREYLSDPTAPVLSGALFLIDFPAPAGEDAELADLRAQVLLASPALAERQAQRLLPLFHETRGIIRLKLASLRPEQSPESLDSAAETITQIAGALVLRAPHADDRSAPLDDLRWIWDRLV